MSNRSYFQAWLIHYFFMYFIVSLCHSAIVCLTLSQVSFTLTLTSFLLLDLVLIVQSFFVHSVCSRTKIGLMVGLTLYAIQFLVSFVYKSNTVKTFGMAQLVSVSPIGACILILKEMVFAQSVGHQVNWANLMEIVNFTCTFNNLASLVANIIFWLIVFLYCERVFPNEWGVKEHPLFFINWVWGNRTQDTGML